MLGEINHFRSDCVLFEWPNVLILNGLSLGRLIALQILQPSCIRTVGDFAPYAGERGVYLATNR
jgi:hypothetical protein